MALRCFVLVGWRAVLGLRLGPLHGPDHVLGWHIRGATPDVVTLELESWLITATNVVGRNADQVVWTTNVDFRRRGARFVWAIVLPIHKLVIPYVLRRAARLAHPGEEAGR